MAKIFIFRHGQTEDNLEHEFSGWRNVDLDQNGIKEAEGIAQKLKDEKVTRAYQSDLIRSQHTLQIVLKTYHEQIEPVTDSRIRERDYGDLTGLNKDSVDALDPKDYSLWHRSYEVAPPNGESIKDVEVRVLSFLHEVIPTFGESEIIFISAHGTSIRPMRRYFENITIKEMCSYENIPGKIYEYQI